MVISDTFSIVLPGGHDLYSTAMPHDHLVHVDVYAPVKLFVAIAAPNRIHGEPLSL